MTTAPHYALLKIEMDRARAENADLTFEEAHAQAILAIVRVLTGAAENQRLAIVVTNPDRTDDQPPYIVSSEMDVEELACAVAMLREQDDALRATYAALIGGVKA